MEIVFLSEGIDFQLDNKEEFKSWLIEVCREEKAELVEILYRFVSEKRILEINRKYLNHDYYTDIISFDESFLNEIRGDIYICIDVVRRNCFDIAGNSFEKELQRVLVHGLLHLTGLKDSSDQEKLFMRRKEEYYMAMLDRR